MAARKYDMTSKRRVVMDLFYKSGQTLSGNQLAKMTHTHKSLVYVWLEEARGPYIPRRIHPPKPRKCTPEREREGAPPLAPHNPISYGAILENTPCLQGNV